MHTAEPAALAAAFERGVPVPPGPGDRLAGYAVLGVSFHSGHLLALRRFPVRSNGPAYTSVWHRDPNGDWTFYADVPPDQGCARYFAPVLKRAVIAPIRVEWNGPRSLAIAVDGGRAITWSVEMSPTLFTRAFNSIAPRVSAFWTQHPVLLHLVAFAARVGLGLRDLQLTGRTPSGCHSIYSPQALWVVHASRASVAGTDVGTRNRRGLFTAAHAFML